MGLVINFRLHERFSCVDQTFPNVKHLSPLPLLQWRHTFPYLRTTFTNSSSDMKKYIMDLSIWRELQCATHLQVIRLSHSLGRLQSRLSHSLPELMALSSSFSLCCALFQERSRDNSVNFLSKCRILLRQWPDICQGKIVFWFMGRKVFRNS